ncbi:hypothetical protein BC835DRAFT_1292776 [Cytidiella melzeri]|nr:hypothetical protein BC835DRAFT_1292776 [Cytidiella melzeri]
MIIPRERELSERNRARSQSSKPAKGASVVEWDVLSPLPVPELEGMIIETLATSRATSLSVTALWDALLRTRPALKTMGSSKLEVDTSPLNKREWLQLLMYILAAGHLSSGLFGRPVSQALLHEISRTKSAQRAQWFYVPEKDVDQDRANLVRSMMRGPGKRSETMKYKRYYWKPLGKISRWDREDDL